jgi:toxin ParE1/3/4
MAHRVVWLRAAEQDLDAIADYIADDSPAYASAVVQKMLAAAANLAEFPLIG